MNTAIQPTPTDTPQERVQRVQMSRGELDLYLRDGRPTGTLLRSIAALKGLSAAAVAKACGIPVQVVQAIYADQGMAAMKMGAIKRVADVLGINLRTMRFAAGQVHILNLRNIPALAGRARAAEIVRAAGLLARSARVAQVRFGGRLSALLGRQRTYVAQTEHFRALFIGGRGAARFDLGYLPSSQWVRTSPKDSIVSIRNPELIAGLKAQDLTESEFDEIFIGTGLVWRDIRVAARVNGVSKGDLMAYIESRAREMDESAQVEEQRIVNENAPYLRLVENEQRVAVG